MSIAGSNADLVVGTAGSRTLTVVWDSIEDRLVNVAMRENYETLVMAEYAPSRKDTWVVGTNIDSRAEVVLDVAD